MIRPEWLRSNDIVGVTAVSDGVGDAQDIKRFNNGIKKLGEAGYGVKLTDNVFCADKMGRSSEGKVRWKEYESLLSDNKVKAVISAKGGNFLNEMMEYVDFEKIKANPKWFQGYSDNTWLVHTITTMCDIMTIYGNNFGDFGMDVWHKSVVDNLNILEGKLTSQQSFEKYQRDFGERITGLEGYNEDSEVVWRCSEKSGAKFTGRMIGGCFDVLMTILGTRYDKTEAFVEKYADDGIVWYLESFDISAESLMMNLWKMKECGWFKNVKGFVFGRPLFFNDSFAGYEEAVMYGVGSLGVPVIFDSDIGHRGPRMTIINGAVADVQYEAGKGKIEYIFDKL